MSPHNYTKPIVAVILGVTIALALTSNYSFSTYAQSSQGSAAWAASIAFASAGGANRVDYGASNFGSQPVIICQILRAANGTAISNACTDGSIPARGTSAGKSAAWWYAEQAFLGWSGSVVVYSKDRATPIAPFGWVQIDQQGNKVINGAFSLTWTPTSPPS